MRLALSFLIAFLICSCSTELSLDTRNAVRSALEEAGYEVTDIEMSPAGWLVSWIQVDPLIKESEARPLAERAVQVVRDVIDERGIKASVRILLIVPDPESEEFVRYGSARLSKYGGSLVWEPEHQD